MKSLLSYVLFVTVMLTGGCLAKTPKAIGNELQTVKLTGKKAAILILKSNK